MLSILVSKEVEREKWEQKVDHVVAFLSHLPCRDLPWVSLRLEVICTTVKPMFVAINVELVEVSELILWVVLKVMGLNLIIIMDLWLVFPSSSVRTSCAFVWSWNWIL